MGSIPTKPKHWIQSLDRHCHSSGISRSPQASPGRSRARPAPAPPAPTAAWGHRDTRTHTHKTSSAFSAPEANAAPAVTGSDHCCFSPGFLRLGWSVCPGEAISRRRVPPGSLPGAAEPERAARRGGRRADPQQLRSGALPESEAGRSRESPRSGRAALGVSAYPAAARPKEAELAITQGWLTRSLLRAPYRPLPGPRQPGPGSVPVPPPPRHTSPSPAPLTCGGRRLRRLRALRSPRALSSAPATPSGPPGLRLAEPPAHQPPAGPDLPMPFSIDLKNFASTI